MTDPIKTRPDWARRLDGVVMRILRLLGRGVGRPSERTLSDLAGRQRPLAVSIPPEPLEAGRAALANGAYAEALHEFGQLLALAPEHPWAWHGRGDALQLMGEHASALEAYERACEIQPDIGLHHGGRANALAAMGQTAESEVAWSRAIGLDSELGWMRSGPKR